MYNLLGEGSIFPKRIGRHKTPLIIDKNTNKKTLSKINREYEITEIESKNGHIYGRIGSSNQWITLALIGNNDKLYGDFSLDRNGKQWTGNINDLKNVLEINDISLIDKIHNNIKSHDWDNDIKEDDWLDKLLTPIILIILLLVVFYLLGWRYGTGNIFRLKDTSNKTIQPKKIIKV